MGLLAYPCGRMYRLIDLTLQVVFYIINLSRYNTCKLFCFRTPNFTLSITFSPISAVIGQITDPTLKLSSIEFSDASFAGVDKLSIKPQRPILTE